MAKSFKHQELPKDPWTQQWRNRAAAARLIATAGPHVEDPLPVLEGSFGFVRLGGGGPKTHLGPQKD